MADTPLWATALKWALWVVLVALVMGWLGRSRFRVRPAPDTRTLAHPPSTLVVGVVCSAFFAGLAVVSNVFRNSTTTWWTTAIFLGFAALSALLIVDYFTAKHEVTDEGLSYSKLLAGTRKHLRWSDLRDVRYAHGMKWFRLETTGGDVARISALLMGLPEFARLLLEHAPEGVIHTGTLQILQATAQGSPPSVWA
jgi:Bacterial PH domain